MFPALRHPGECAEIVRPGTYLDFAMMKLGRASIIEVYSRAPKEAASKDLRGECAEGSTFPIFF